MLRGADRTELTRRLITVCERTQLRSLLNNFTDRLQELPMSAADMFGSLSDAADRLVARSTETPPSLHDNYLFGDIDELLCSLPPHIPQGERATAVRNVIQMGTSLAFPAIVWQRLCLRSGIGYETSRPEVLLPRADVEQLGRVVAERLEREAAGPNLER